jgi:hypothetical protein
MTQRLLLSALVAAAIMSVTGCHEQQQGAHTGESLRDNRFPDFLVGTWTTEEYESRWIFVFDANGDIPMFRHFVGMAFRTEEGVLHEQWRGTAQAMYALGPVAAEYDPNTENLTVSVSIDDYIIDFPNGKMEGYFRDVLTGPVSQENLTWNVEWTSTSEIEGVGESTETRTLTFRKVIEDPNEIAPQPIPEGAV